jgi:type I restriction enzyme, R subunit
VNLISVAVDEQHNIRAFLARAGATSELAGDDVLIAFEICEVKEIDRHVLAALAERHRSFARVVNDIDEIVRLVRFDGWQATHAGEREVKLALRKTLFKYKLHQDQELFDRAYGYVREYY